MSTTQGLLPAGFEALEPFVTTWAVDGAHQRMQRRLDSEASEREAFFNAGKDLVPTALERLDGKAFDAFDEQEQRLMLLVLSMAHVAQAVEIQGDDEPGHARYARYITITRASADSNPSTGGTVHAT
jgi:hypothetical protein